MQGIRYVTEDILRTVCYERAKERFATQEEPITPYEENNLGKLQAILANPRQTFGGQELYPTLSEKAAILYYGFIKGHPLQNGNKRMATVTLLVFLKGNGIDLSGSDDDLAQMAIAVAKSNVEEKDEIIARVRAWIDEK